MKTLGILALILISFNSYAVCNQQKQFSLVIHAGSGSGHEPKAKQEEILKVMKEATTKGRNMLRVGATAEDVVVATVTIFEDSPVFNAGRGGNPNEQGFVELDASIMRGSDKNAGAVAAVKKIKNPIKAALAVMNNSRHVMFVSEGAENFAKSQKLEMVPNEYFYSGLRFESNGKEIGTVGAVAMDRCGNWVAGTSTGGFKTKTPGRVGDSPIIGAGTYAENKTCAVSCTGHGEFFIRYAVSHSICSLIKHKGYSGKKAAEHMLQNELLPAGGKGGVIVIDNEGVPSYFFTTKGMSRGMVTESMDVIVGIY